MVEVIVNGEPRQLPAGSTVLSLLEQLSMDPRVVAVEHNGEILRRPLYGQCSLRSGDRLEIVHFVQGG